MMVTSTTSPVQILGLSQAEARHGQEPPIPGLKNCHGNMPFARQWRQHPQVHSTHRNPTQNSQSPE